MYSVCATSRVPAVLFSGVSESRYSRSRVNPKTFPLPSVAASGIDLAPGASTQKRPEVGEAMDSVGGGPGDEGPHGLLSPQSLSVLGEGISLVFSRWTALQMAVENAWGGKDSRSKSEELASTILSWFSQSKGAMVVVLKIRASMPPL